MKKFYTICAALLFGCTIMTAQQLPNAGFSEWTDCYPWSSTRNTTTNESKKGQTPTGWNISHVTAKNNSTASVEFTDVKTTGRDGASNGAVLLNNKSVAGLATVPAYMTLGKTWSTAAGLLGNKNRDGGSWGGLAFTYRPDALNFYYKKKGTTQASTAMVYLWKGTFYQASVPAEIKSSSPATVTMENRDRNVLGMSTSEGGAVTSTSGAELIAKNVNYISAATDAWTECTMELEYTSTATPEMINVIFAGGDYFNSSPSANMAITVDDVKLLYYSRLASLSVNGTPVAGFNNASYTYNIDAPLPENTSAITYTKLGNSGSATVNVTLDTANDRAVITVTGQGEDKDGATSHVYTLQFNKATTPDPGPDPEPGVDPENPDTPEPTGDAIEYNGTLIISMDMDEDGVLDEGDPQDGMNVYIIPTGEGKCTFALYDFMGSDIIVPNCTVTTNGDGTKTYSGYCAHLTLFDGAVNADAQVEATEDASGNLAAFIHVKWFTAWDDGSQPNPDPSAYSPIEVTFNGKTTVAGSDSNDYKGTLVISMDMDDDGVLDEGEPQEDMTVHIIPTGEGKCTFALYDFMGSDIIVPDCTVVTNPDGSKTYSGYCAHLTLMDGAINADAQVEATEDASGKLVAYIHVKWFTAWEDGSQPNPDESAYSPIEVSFNGQGNAGIDGVIADEIDNSNAPVEMYNIRGQRVNENNVAPGIYIRRQGTDVKKILIK